MIPAAPNASAIHPHRVEAASSHSSATLTTRPPPPGPPTDPPTGPPATPLATGGMRQRRSVQVDAGGGGKRGLLVKKGHVLRTQRERLFVLQGATLSYFRVRKAAAAGERSESELKGVLQLEETDVITPTKGSEVWFRIHKLAGPDGKSYKLDLKASDARERLAWIEALRSACRGEALAKQKSIRSTSFRRAGNAAQDHALLSSTVAASASSKVISGSVDSGRCLTPQAELRASFQAFHELVLLQKLVDEAKTSWGSPHDWTVEQYQTLVRSISLAQEKLGSSEIRDSPILAQAFALRYQFEEIAENQRKLSRGDGVSAGYGDTKSESPVSPTSSPPSPSRAAVPRHLNADKATASPIHSYFSTFEKLLSPPDAGGGGTQDLGSPLTPRHVTMAKYARLYLESDKRAKQPWSLERADGDDIRDGGARQVWSDAQVVDILINRFKDDRVYTWLSDRSMAFINPFRMLQTPKFTSIYDEEVVLTYASSQRAEQTLAPHPFAVAKMAVTRAFVGAVVNRGRSNIDTALAANDNPLSILLCGESGSGKTELAKELLKYLVLTAEPVLMLGGSATEREKNASTAKSSARQPESSNRRPRVQLFTSSTKSTVQMRSEEARTIALLEAKGVDDFELVLLDLDPQRWPEMTSVSHSKRLPQLHVDGLFFGFYDSLERLADVEQLRIYLKNPRAAKKLSMVLDSNVILEAFGHASTAMNANSSRFGKATTVELALGQHPDQFQIRGCWISPFLLEKSRVTVARGSGGPCLARDDGISAWDGNFHIFYAMVAGVNAIPSQRATLARELWLGGVSCDEFAYLGPRSSASKSAQHAGDARGSQEIWKRDVDKWIRVLDALTAMEMSTEEQRGVFKVLSAVLWLGNISFEAQGDSRDSCVRMASTARSEARVEPQEHVASLLGLASVDRLEKLLTTRRVRMATTGEAFEVRLERGQVEHMRDALARLLYHAVFTHVVNRMNAMTRADAGGDEDGAGASRARIEVVDVFGFEALPHNSLDQLCINYLSEKLFSRQDEVLTAVCRRYGADGAATADQAMRDPDSTVLSLYEHPGSGIFASLEELTVLHQGENETPEQERRRNELLVRTLTEKSPALRADAALAASGRPQAPHMRALLFAVPHARGSVVYDADEFVKKNSDFVHASALEELAAAAGSDAAAVLSSAEAAAVAAAAAAPAAAAMSLARQFRLQVGALTRREPPADADDCARPFYFHCLRPNADVRPAAAHAALVLAQVRAQRLARHVALSAALRARHSVSSPVEAVRARYGCLVAARALDSDAQLARALHDVVHGGCARPECGAVRVGGGRALLRGVGDVEALEQRLAAREQAAATRIQARARMRRCRRAFLAGRARRRRLRDELLALYGRAQGDKATRALRKYRGREDELAARLREQRLARAQERQAAQALEKELRARLRLRAAPGGALSARVVGEMAADEALRARLQRDEAVLAALRDVSLRPERLSAQLADPTLRAFYEELLAVLRRQEAAEGDGERGGARGSEQGGGGGGAASAAAVLDERVRAAVARGNGKWMALARRDEWAAHRSPLEEVGEDPELLVFHAEAEGFAPALAAFLDALDAEEASDEEPAMADEEGEGEGEELAGDARAGREDAELRELLLSVRFDAALLDAMRADAFFARALRDPALAASLAQLMASGGRLEPAAIQALQTPAAREFLLQLVGLSFALQGGDESASASDEDEQVGAER